MKREIKFRAWDSGSKQMLLHHEIDLSDKDGIILWGEIFSGKEPLELMQFSGLLDKNGKEIYEGDVVKWTSRNGNTQVHVDKIEWIDEYACYMLMPWCHELHYADMKVIGNIYENPELLK